MTVVTTESTTWTRWVYVLHGKDGDGRYSGAQGVGLWLGLFGLLLLGVGGSRGSVVFGSDGGWIDT